MPEEVPGGRFLPLDPRPLAGGILLTLFGGTAVGAAHLLYVHGLYKPSPLTHVQAHAHAQVFGFFGAFLSTFGLHLLPKFTQRRTRLPALSRWTPALILAGAFLHFVGQTGTKWEYGYWALLASAPFMVLGGLSFGFQVLALLDGFDARDAFDRYVRYGALMFALAAVADGGLSVRAFVTREPLYPYPWAQALWQVALYGGVLMFTLGVAARLAYPMLGGGFVTTRVFRYGYGILWGAIPLEAAAWLLPSGGSLQLGFLALARAASGLGLCVSLGAFLFPQMRPSGLDMDPFFSTAVVSAFSLLGVAALARLATGVWELAGGPLAPLVHDAVRHLVTVGFLLVLTVAMATKLVPSLRKVELRWGGLRWVALGLLLTAVALRSVEVLAAWGRLSALKASAASGVVAWVALASFGAMMMRTARQGAGAGTG